MLRRMACVVALFLIPLLASAQTTLNGAGSSFVYPIMSKWAGEYHKLHPEIQMSYYPNGSWPGMVLTMAGMIDFGATDAPVSDAQLAKATIPVIQVPVILDADVPSWGHQASRHDSHRDTVRPQSFQRRCFQNKCLSRCKRHLDFSACPSEEFQNKKGPQRVSRLDRYGRSKVRDRSLLFASVDRSRSRGGASAG